MRQETKAICSYCGQTIGRYVYTPEGWTELIIGDLLQVAHAYGRCCQCGREWRWHRTMRGHADLDADDWKNLVVG